MHARTPTKQEPGVGARAVCFSACFFHLAYTLSPPAPRAASVRRGLPHSSGLASRAVRPRQCGSCAGRRWTRRVAIPPRLLLRQSTRVLLECWIAWDSIRCGRAGDPVPRGRNSGEPCSLLRVSIALLPGPGRSAGPMRRSRGNCFRLASIWYKYTALAR